MSKHLMEWVVGNYRNGDYVICQCSSKCLLKNNPLPGEFSTCIGCGFTFAQAEAAFLTLKSEYEAKEKIAIENKADDEEEGEDGFPKERPSNIAMAVYNTFKDIVRIARKETDESCWDKSKLGDSVVECMETFNKYYSTKDWFPDSSSKTAVLNSFRKESSHEEVLEKLAAKMEELSKK